MEAVMVAPLLVSPASHDDEIEDYSEWRLFLGVSRFDHVGVNSGFQNRDFQTNQGTSIIVDPEVYRKLQDEASAIWTKLFRTKMELVVVWYLCVFLYFAWLIVRELTLVDILVRSAVSGVLGIWLFTAVVPHCLQKNADSRTTAVVDSYKEHFLNAYGVELGYGVLVLECGKLSQYSYNLHFFKAYGQFPGPGILNRSDQGGPTLLNRAIYLRRPRRSAEGAVLTAGDHQVQDVGRLPPTFIDCMLPGDIHVNEKDHNATMKVDAETWALLQAVHQDHMWIDPLSSGFIVVFSTISLFWCVFWWVSQETVAQNAPLFVRLDFLLIFLCLWLLRRIIINTLNHWNSGTRYEEVARCVNEALANDASRSHLAVEFRTSDLPGRDKSDSRRYQFVKRDLTPTKAIE